MESDLQTGSAPATHPANMDATDSTETQAIEIITDNDNQNGEAEQVSERETTSPSSECREILKAMEVVERDSVAIAQSFTSLFGSLRSSLSQVSGSSIDHMSCFSDAAGRLQESALDAVTKGNRYINSCLRLNEEMKGMENLSSHLYPWLFVYLWYKFVHVFLFFWLFVVFTSGAIDFSA